MAQRHRSQRESVLKTVQLRLSKFPVIPNSLKSPNGSAALSIGIDLAKLYHHYYIDSRGMAPPNPDPAEFEHIRYLMNCPEFRFQRNGLGTNKTFRGNKSNELGQAFCRLFMQEHLEMIYVGHIDDVRDHGSLSAYGGLSIETNSQVVGDAPDYFCTTPANTVCLAEAKGSLSAVGFGTKRFQTWRQQFNRVLVKDASGTALTVKGYIVATRWAMEDDSARIATTIAAEDPETEGRRRINPEDSRGLALAIKSVHYAYSLRRLRQPLMFAALVSGGTVPADLSFNAIIWRCLLPGFEHFRFVGGYFPGGDGTTLPFDVTPDGGIIFNRPNPLRLDIASGTFIGIEKQIFSTLAETARRGPDVIGQLERAPAAGGYYSGISYLPDGQIMGPIEFFIPEAPITL